jgi:hypothetical protein
LIGRSLVFLFGRPARIMHARIVATRLRAVCRLRTLGGIVGGWDAYSFPGNRIRGVLDAVADRVVRLWAHSERSFLKSIIGRSASGLFRMAPGPLLIGILLAWVGYEVGVQLAAHGFSPAVLPGFVLFAFFGPLGAFSAHVPKVDPWTGAVER